MARKSKFRKTVESAPKFRIYSTGIYVRLSVLDGHQDHSDSIRNQEALLQSCVENDPSLSLYSVYSDNGQTGVNFRRKEFERLMDDIRAGKVNCVIVKDLSRFGRNYIETSEYLEKIFPFLGVRFIAVNDSYDSIDSSASDSLSMYLKNLVNDTYARDVSQKICSVLYEKQERGEFIGNWVYGYLKSKDHKNHLVVDEETAPIVRMIFQLRLSGMKYQDIARRLNRQGVFAPSRYRFEKGMVKNSRYADTIWKGDVIRKILSSEVYLGHMVQGKTGQALWKGEEQTARPKNRQNIVRNTHEALVDGKTFDAIQQMGRKTVQEYVDKQHSQTETTENILKGLVYCGDCGRRLRRQKCVHENKRKNPGLHIQYFFGCHTHSIDKNRCVSVRTPEDATIEAVSHVIQSHLVTMTDMETLMKSAHRKASALSKQQKIQKKRKQVQEQLERIARLRETLYEDYIEHHLMNERDYLYAKKRYGEQEAEKRGILEELAAQEAVVQENGIVEPIWFQPFQTFGETQKLTRELALELIDRVIIYSRNHITVQLRFEDEYQRLKEKLYLSKGVEFNE